MWFPLLTDVETGTEKNKQMSRKWSKGDLNPGLDRRSSDEQRFPFIHSVDFLSVVSGRLSVLVRDKADEQ